MKTFIRSMLLFCFFVFLGTTRIALAKVPEIPTKVQYGILSGVLPDEKLEIKVKAWDASGRTLFGVDTILSPIDGRRTMITIPFHGVIYGRDKVDYSIISSRGRRCGTVGPQPIFPQNPDKPLHLVAIYFSADGCTVYADPL